MLVNYATIRRAVGMVFLIWTVVISANGQTVTTPTDGQTPLGIEPGAPAGSYALSGFDNINLFNGKLNFQLPLLQIGGRGNAKMTMTLPIELHWQVFHWSFPPLPPAFEPIESDIPLPTWWTPLRPGYGPGVLFGRRAGMNKACGAPLGSSIGYTLTRLTFSAPDGTEYELRDVATGGKPYNSLAESCQGFVPNNSRGQTFISADGSAMTFISDALITDGAGLAEVIYPSGYLLLRDGSRFRIDEGIVSWIRDRDGNKLTFFYDQFKRVTTIIDSMNREITVAYFDPQENIWYDEITFRGFAGATRKIYVRYTNLASVLRSGAAEGSTGFTLKRMNQLFPELNGANGDFNNPWIISEVELPDSRDYRFYYNSYGEIARVELPTGGAYEYDYTPGSGVLPFQDFYPAQIYRRVIERRVYTNGSTLERRTTYAATETIAVIPDPSFTTVEVKDFNSTGGLMQHQKHYFHNTPKASFGKEAIVYSAWQDGKEYMTEAYAANGSVIRRAENFFEQRTAVPWWSTWTEPGGGSSHFEPPNDVRLSESRITFSDITPNLVSKQVFAYDQYNNKTHTWEYDFGSNSPPAFPLRHTRTDFLTTNPINGVNYATNNDIHLRSLVKEQFIYDVNPSTGAETLAAQTRFEYDKYDMSQHHALLVPRSGISSHDGSFGTSYQTRGNVTATSRWLNTASSWITVHQQYDIAGNVVATVDALGRSTAYDFADRFGGPDGDARANTIPSELSALGQTSYAYPTSETNPLGHKSYTQYDYYIGRAVDSENEKGVIFSGYYNDLLDRPTQLIEAVNVAALKNQTSFTYNDPGRSVTTTVDQNTFGDNQSRSEVVYDGLGRVIENRTYETPSAYIASRQNYDALSRQSQTSNPFRPGDPIFWTTTAYDILGRVANVTGPDQSQSTTSYSGNATTMTDPAGKTKRCVKDMLGRVTKTIEDPSGLNLETTYKYDALNKLRTVTQGVQTRTHTYDTLGRMTQANIPEQTAPTFYIYDANSNIFRFTDPRGIVTEYTYDLINRVTFVNYSDTTPDETYSYDAPTVSYSKGQLTGVSTSVSSYTYDEYDALGRVKRSTQTTDGQPYQMSYSYDLGGNLTSQVYPSGRTITTNYDAVDRVSGVNGTKIGELPKTYASTISYTAHGILKSMLLGNGLWEHTLSNERLQLTEIGLGASSADSSKMKLNYTYGVVVNNVLDTTKNNGHVESQTVTVSGTAIKQSYVYDPLHRLTSVKETVGVDTKWIQTYSYDRYSNRTSLVNTGSDASMLTTQGTPAVVTATNRLQNHTYDQSGNMKVDAAGNTFNYDAANRQVTSTVSGITANYFYDGSDRRVKKVAGGVTTVFIYDLAGKLIAEYTNSGPASLGGTSYLTMDHLGSVRVVTDGSGVVKSRRDYCPFGEELGAGIGGRTGAMGYGQVEGLKQKFTSKERDSESGLDYFGARYYSSTTGRFTGVDPLMGSADVAMPQTWNRYAYALNNPMNIIDPDGMIWVENTFTGQMGWLDITEKEARKRGYKVLPEGTIRIITAAPPGSSYEKFVGHMVVLGSSGRMLDLGLPRPTPIEEINFWAGAGQQFLASYLKFAGENLAGNLIGAGAVRAISKIFQWAKSSRVARSTLQVLQEKGYCFVAGTKVITEEGEQAIEKLNVGDKVLSTDPECGETGYKKVVRLFERMADEVVDIFVEGSIITATVDHPFWVEGQGWIAAASLVRGSPLLTKDGTVVRVESIIRRSGSFKVYNFEVEALHTYFVSKLGVLVHNDCIASKTLKEWLKDHPDLLQEATEMFLDSPEWFGVDPDNTPVEYKPKAEVDKIRAKKGESGGHHPHGLALGGPEGQTLTLTNETRTYKNPLHNKATALQRKIINVIKKLSD
jgi:RHS repeat-associated protein